MRRGDSLHTIEVDRMGAVTLLPCSSWHWEGDAHPSTWTVRATVYGPSTRANRQLGCNLIGSSCAGAVGKEVECKSGGKVWLRGRAK